VRLQRRNLRGELCDRGPVDAVVPVDVYIPGCPPIRTPLLHGILTAVAAPQGGIAAAGGAKTRPNLLQRVQGTGHTGSPQNIELGRIRFAIIGLYVTYDYSYAI